MVSSSKTDPVHAAPIDDDELVSDDDRSTDRRVSTVAVDPRSAIELTATVEQRGGLALVTCRVRNRSDIAVRVRLKNALDGPVLPPRRRGDPEPGWDVDGCTRRLAGNASLGLGYVCPTLAPAESDPVTVDSVVPVDDDDDALPASGSRSDGGSHQDPIPIESAIDRLETRLDAIAEDLDRFERLQEADLETATAVVSEAGGLDALRDRVARMDSKIDRIGSLRRRTATICDRRARIEVPIESLERLS